MSSLALRAPRHAVRAGVCAAVLVALLLPGAAASAAPLNGLALIAADPGDHETIPFAPDHVSLTFDRRLGDATTIAIAVSAPGGTRVERGPVEVDGAVASIRLHRHLGSGDYTVGFVVARTGGGSISGSLIFEVQLPPPHSVVTDPPEVIASALARLQSPRPSPPARDRASARHRHAGGSATASPVATASAAAGPAPAARSWWSDSTVIAVGAVLLLVLAGAAVFLPGRRDDD